MFGFNLFPYTNFHDINMDWIIKNLKTLWTKSVFTVNNTPPDAEGNVNLAGVSGVTAVDGIGADGAGNVQLDAVRKINNVTPTNGDITISETLGNSYRSTFTTHADISSSFIRSCVTGYIASVLVTITIGTDISASSNLITDMFKPYYNIGYEFTLTNTSTNDIKRVGISGTNLVNRELMEAGTYSGTLTYAVDPTEKVDNSLSVS